MRKAIALPLLAILLIGAACSSGPDQAEPPTTEEAGTVAVSSNRLLAPASFARYMEDNPDVPVVNVHIPYEGHIEGTDSFVAFDEITDWDGLPEDRSDPLALYCRSGNMSAEATETLAAMGYTNVVDLEGGMNVDRGRVRADHRGAAIRGLTGQCSLCPPAMPVADHDLQNRWGPSGP